MDPAQPTDNPQTVPPPVAPQVTPVAPVGGRKEAEIAADAIAKQEGDEYWESYAREIELEKEIEEMGGVEKVESGEVKIPQEVAAEMGIKPTVGPQTPIEAATGFSVRGVTLSDDQITAGLSKPTSSGLRWLVEWFIFQLLRAHFFVKKVGGKIIRKKQPSA